MASRTKPWQARRSIPSVFSSLEAPALASVMVVEDDRALTDGMGVVAALRNGGMIAELIASGSPRKRFDKAVKSNTQAILALGWGDEGATNRLRNVDGAPERIESLLADFAWSK